MYTISPPMLMISIGMQNVDIGSRRAAAPHSRPQVSRVTARGGGGTGAGRHSGRHESLKKFDSVYSRNCGKKRCFGGASAWRMARAWPLLVPLLLNACMVSVSAAAALPGDDCAWAADGRPSCAAMCDKNNIRAPDCGKTSNETCKWCSEVDVSGLSSDADRALFCRAHYFVDPWEDAAHADLRTCQYDTERKLCASFEGPGGRLYCQNPPPSPPPLPPASPPPLPSPWPAAPPPSPFPPAAAAFDLNVFDIVAIFAAVLLTIPLIRAAKAWLVLRFTRAMVTPRGGQGLGDDELEVADDLEGRASRDRRRAARKQDKAKLLQPS